MKRRSATCAESRWRPAASVRQRVNFAYNALVDQVLADESVDVLDTAGDVLWALTDNLGSVRDLVNNDGTVQNHLTYGAFGEVTSETDSSVDFLIGYAGRERDKESGLVNMRNRYYDPRTGRFLGQDSSGFLAGDTNLQRYVGNSPTNFTDPFGLDATGSGGGGDGGDWVSIDLSPHFPPPTGEKFEPDVIPEGKFLPPPDPLPDIDIPVPVDPTLVFTTGEFPDFVPTIIPTPSPPLRPGLIYDTDEPPLVGPTIDLFPPIIPWGLTPDFSPQGDVGEDMGVNEFLDYVRTVGAQSLFEVLRNNNDVHDYFVQWTETVFGSDAGTWAQYFVDVIDYNNASPIGPFGGARNIDLGIDFEGDINLDPLGFTPTRTRVYVDARF